jgi:hypothetical protein
MRVDRFFVMWNVTEPYEYLAVGPLVRWGTSLHPSDPQKTNLTFRRVAVDTPDAEIVYAMSLLFRPAPTASYLRQRADAAREARYGTMHGFLDDELFVSLGVRDNEMGTVRMRAGEAVVGMQIC